MSKIVFYNIILILILALVILYTCNYSFSSITSSNLLNLNTNSNTNFNTNTNSNSKKYYKCGRLGNNDPTENVLTSNNYSRTTDKYDNWEIYIPCGYTNVENELEDFNYFSESYNKSKPELKDRKTIFAISGCDLLASKDKLWQALETKYTRSEARLIMPETYITANKHDMELFKQRFNSKKIYICKKNIQDKKGLELVSGDYNLIIKKVYSEKYKLVQEYLENPLLIKGRKLNLRLYFVVLCDESVKMYLYSEGKCIYTNKNYSKNANINDLESHITSVNLDVAIYDDLPESMEDLKKFLGDDKFRSLFDKIIAKLKKITLTIKPNVCNINKDYDGFQLFGLDIIIDEKMNPYVLEFNKGPAMTYKTKNDKKLKTQLFNDLFCLANLSEKDKCSSNLPEKWIMLNP